MKKEVPFLTIQFKTNIKENSATLNTVKSIWMALFKYNLMFCYMVQPWTFPCFNILIMI